MPESKPAGFELAPDVGRPVVSVIIANYNSFRFIEATLHSALRQNLREIEVIVADDGSTDGGEVLIAAMAARDRRLILLPPAGNMGPSAARNRCIEAARGRWIAVMDSDDLMHPDRLSRLIASAERDGADIAADDLLIFDDQGGVAPARCLRGAGASAPFWVEPADYVRSNVLFGRRPPLGYLKPVIRADLLTNSKTRYDPDLRLAEDYDFILRLMLLGARMRVYPELTYFYRKHGQSISHRLSRDKLNPVLRASETFRSGIDTAAQSLRAALDERHASLRRALAFDALVVALQERDWPAALRLAVRNPGAARLLYLPILARLRSLLRPAWHAGPIASHARRVCVISRHAAPDDANQGSAYLFSLCEALRRAGMDLHLVCPRPVISGPWRFRVMRPNAGLFGSVRIRGAIRIGPVFIAAGLYAPSRAAAAISGPATPAEALFLARHARGNADSIVAGDVFLTECMPYLLRPDAPSVVAVAERLSGEGARPARAGSVAPVSETREMAMLAGAGAAVAAIPADAELIRARLPSLRVVLGPNAAAPVAAPQPGMDGHILFVGDNTAPNVTGLRWFLDKVWPIIHASVPDAELTVAGSISAAAISGGLEAGMPGVRLLGSVSCVESLYMDAAVVIFPLLSAGGPWAGPRTGPGTGLIDALGQAKAIVATAAAVRELDAPVRDAVVVGDDAVTFAAAVAALSRDRTTREALGAAALAVARALFSTTAGYAEFVDYVAGATPGDNSPPA